MLFRSFDITINSVTYNIKSNLTQYVLLNKFISTDNYNINNLQNDFNINPADINSELNALFKSKLITKSGDINITINFNQSFTSDTKFIDLVELYEKAEAFLLYRKTFNPSECKAILYNIFQSNPNNKFTFTELGDKLFLMNIAVLKNELQQFLDEYIDSNIIIKNNETYVFSKKISNEFDSEEDRKSTRLNSSHT